MTLYEKKKCEIMDFERKEKKVISQLTNFLFGTKINRETFVVILTLALYVLEPLTIIY